MCFANSKTCAVKRIERPRRITDDGRRAEKLCGNPDLSLLLDHYWYPWGRHRGCIMTSSNNNVTAGFGSRSRSFMYRGNGWKERKTLWDRFKRAELWHVIYTLWRKNSCNTKNDNYNALQYIITLPYMRPFGEKEQFQVLQALKPNFYIYNFLNL